MIVGLISDTHGMLRPEIFDVFRDVELILHAGDVGHEGILTELQALAPVHAVVGNTDPFPLAGRLPEVQRLELAGTQVVVTHGHLQGAPTAARLVREFPEAGVIIYGHTHQSLVERVADTLVVNPGAAGPARFRLKPSVAILELGTELPQVTIIDL